VSFYSPIDRLAQTLPRPKGTGAEFMTELSKMPGYKAQEAEDRGLQALVNMPKMERAQFLEIMRLAKPAVVPKTGALQTPHHEDYTLPGGSNYREILLTHPNPKAKFQGVPHHFGGVPNILASVRAKDRKGPNGEKILHIEELQSDWHQKGRERGYIGQETPKINEEEHKRALGLQQRDIRGEELTPEERNELEEIRNRHISSIPAVRVPDAPFKKNWHEMALKKMIHHAAENGYDSIAITPGAEQADRYGLAKHLGEVQYNHEFKRLAGFDKSGTPVIYHADVEPEQLPNYIGKEVATKLLAQPKNNQEHSLKGVDLQVGGEGMKGFYDKIVPNFLNQFGKKYGAKVGQIQVPVVHALQGLRRVNGYPDDPPLNLHHFPITPEMREDVTKNGVPLYAKGGSVEDESDVPKKTVKAYKLFRVHPKHPGKLFPLFVDANTPVEMDKWIDAKEGEMAKGKVKSKIGPLAYRPGWHAGDLPIATHIGEKSDPSLTAPDVRPENHAWAEVEMPDDVDWQAEATKRGTNAQGRVIPVKAHITDQIPKGGHYRYKTNPNMTGNWLIGGSMKVNRVLTDKEVAKINKAAGLADLPRAQPFKAKKFGFAGGGTVAPDEWKAEAHVNHMADGGPVPPLRPLSPQLAALREQMAQQSALNKAYDEAMKNVYTNQMPTFAQWVASQGKAKGGKVSREEHDANLAKFLAESKVKDRLYHGTDKDFSEFKFNPKKSMGTWLTNRPKLASAYSEVSARGGDNSVVYPLYAQIKNPASEKDFMDARDIAQAQSGTGGWHDHTIRHKQLLLDKGFDGVKLKDGTYIAFEPTQIKSAIGNRGTYDPSNPDITKAKGGRIKPVGYTKEQITVSPNLDAMRYELMSVKRYTKKVK